MSVGLRKPPAPKLLSARLLFSRKKVLLVHRLRLLRLLAGKSSSAGGAVLFGGAKAAEAVLALRDPDTPGLLLGVDDRPVTGPSGFDTRPLFSP